jgi:hexokinase
LQDLTLKQLNEIREALVARMDDGLRRDHQQVACLPAYLAQPQAGLRGRALVVDAGGTNVRAALVELGERAVVSKGPLKGSLPDGRHAPVQADRFFGYQADLLRQLGAPLDLPLGYCFSYAARVEPDGDARLLHWTKGIQVEGVVGELVGRALRSSLGTPGPVKVLNDTVACLLGGAYWAGTDFTNYIGLIVGTGNNMATFLPAARVPKLEGPWQGLLAVNLESGNFHPPHLHAVDEHIDQASDNPGKQRYEKAVSGFYLPQLLQCLCPQLNLPAESSSEVVVEWADREGQDPASLAARWLLRRSADMVAAALAGVADHLPAGPLAIQAEGGLFWKATGYADRVQQTLAKLLDSSRSFAILRGDEVNLVGAAVAALSG